MASSKRLLLCIFDMSDKIHIIPICILCILCRQSLCFLYVSCTNWHSYLNAYFNLSNLLNSSICFACDWYLSFHFPYSIFSKVYNINWEQVFFVTNLNWGCNIMKCCTFFISKSIYCTRIFHFYFFFFQSSGNYCIYLSVHISPDTVLVHPQSSIPLHNDPPIKQYCLSSVKPLTKIITCCIVILVDLKTHPWKTQQGKNQCNRSLLFFLYGTISGFPRHSIRFFFRECLRLILLRHRKWFL